MARVLASGERSGSASELRLFLASGPYALHLREAEVADRPHNGHTAVSSM